MSGLLQAFQCFAKLWQKVLRGFHCLLLWHEAGMYGDGCSVRALQFFLFHFCSIFWRMVLHEESISLELSPGVTESFYLPSSLHSPSSTKVAPADGSAARKRKQCCFLGHSSLKRKVQWLLLLGMSSLCETSVYCVCQMTALLVLGVHGSLATIQTHGREMWPGKKLSMGFQNRTEEKGIGVCEAVEELFGYPKVENWRLKRGKKWIVEIYKELQSFGVRCR